jgi:hypothetical protein
MDLNASHVNLVIYATTGPIELHQLTPLLMVVRPVLRATIVLEAHPTLPFLVQREPSMISSLERLLVIANYVIQTSITIRSHRLVADLVELLLNLL